MTTYVNPGLDASGNGNNWTTNNINYTSSGSTFDTMTDVPTNTSATAANFCTWNPLDSKTAISSANLNSTYQTGLLSAKGTVGVSSGKWYWEVTVVATGGSGQEGIGIGKIDTFPPTGWVGDSTSSWGYWSDGVKWYNSGTSSYGASWTTGDIIGVALDMDAGTLVFYKNNSSQGTAYSSITGTITPAVSNQNTSSSLALNCGQRPFAYTPPANYVALNTYNLPTPTIGATASSQANKYFDISLYTGNGGTNSITNSNSMQPDFVWTKGRGYVWDNNLFDSVRGATKILISNATNAESTNANSLTAFNSNGFTLGSESGVNNNGSTYVGWQWNAGGSTVTNTSGTISAQVRANTTSGFSVVTYTGNGSAGATFGHGLGVAPSMVIIKDRVDGVADWRCYHVSLGNTKGIFLNLTNAAGTDSSYWNNTSPSSTVVTLGTNIYLNASGHTYVAYCFSAVAGYSAFGSYTGNGSTDGPFVYTGFRPRYVMIKNATNGSDGYWWIHDTARDTYNLADKYLVANGADAEGTSSAFAIDILSNGFKVRGSNNGVNGSGTTLIYMAFAESPFNYANAR